MKMFSLRLAVPGLLSALALVSACGGKQAAIAEVQYGITSAAAIGRMGSLTMDAIKGTTTICAMVQTACTNYPCSNGAVNITLGSGCPLPLGGTASGTVTVTGNWSTADQATLTQTYANTSVGDQGNKALAVAKVTSVTAKRSGNTYTISYAGANATAGANGSAVAVGGSSSWDVTVDTKGTPDPADDTMTVDATSAGGGAGVLGSARVATLKGAVLDPSCRLNPVAGTADITEVSGLIPTITKIQFHAACDGKAEVDGSTQDLQLLP